MGCGRPGYITCSICSATKYYSHVQRRFGQFSCEPCSKFMKRFLRDPKKFTCFESGQYEFSMHPHLHPYPHLHPHPHLVSFFVFSSCSSCLFLDYASFYCCFNLFPFLLLPSFQLHNQDQCLLPVFFFFFSILPARACN